MVLKQLCLNCVLSHPVFPCYNFKSRYISEQLHEKRCTHKNVIWLPVTEPENLRAYKVHFVSFSYREAKPAC